MGSIYKRGNTYWIKYYRAGIVYRESTKIDKEYLAKRLLRLREGKIAEGIIPNLKAEKVIFDDLIQDIRNDYKMNGRRSIDRLERSLKHLIETYDSGGNPFFSGKRVFNITMDTVEQYKAKRLLEGCAVATLNRELATLKRMFNIGVELGKVIRMPKIKTLKENNRRTGYFEANEFIALRFALPEYLRPAITVAYYYGMRREEIFGLTWDQVDLEEGEIRLNPEDTKNEESRAINLNDEVYSILVAQKREKDLKFPQCPYVFFTDKGGKIKDFRGAWASACKKVGLEGKLFHDFRRTAVRNMIRAGVPERVAMKISGHKTRSIFDRYNIVSTEDLKLAAQKISSYHKAKTEDVMEPIREIYGHNFGHNLGTNDQLTEQKEHRSY